MRLLNIRGNLQNKNVRRFLIKWDGKSRSNLQFKTKQFLKKYWSGHIVYEEFPVYGSLLKVDILNATRKIAVEVNGKQHEEFNKFFHNNSRFNLISSLKRDEAKFQWLTKNNFKILELKTEDVDLLSKEYIEQKFNISI